MNLPTIILTIVIIALVGLALRAIIRARKRGGGCGGCSGCSGGACAGCSLNRDPAEERK